ncbi:hypothetical protein D3C83_276580 [compost metagenome]
MYSVAYSAISVLNPVTNNIHSSVSPSMYSAKLATNEPAYSPWPQCRLNQSNRCTRSVTVCC